MARKTSKPSAAFPRTDTQERISKNSAKVNPNRKRKQKPLPAIPPTPPNPASNAISDARSTLTMKPGQISTTTGLAKPRKKYGLPSGQAPSTTVMRPEQSDLIEKAKAATRRASASRAAVATPKPPPAMEDSESFQTGELEVEAAAAVAAANVSVALAAHPVSQNVKPPVIDLVQHELPSDLNDSRLVLVQDSDSEQAAAFRVLRHHILRCDDPQIIAVSGPNDGCGKTTVALNLSMALAECGRAEVLLVDANIRKPKIASILRFVPPWCFAEQLDHHKTQPFSPWTFVDIPSIGLHVAAINPRKEQKPRLDSQAFNIAMERLRLSNYKYIIIDCPSVIGNADVNLIQDATDGVLLTARVREITTRDIRNAVDQLTPTKILGTTLFE